jgi:protein TonB
VSPLPSNTPPRYPTELRRANVEGEVMAQFIVNENGLADSTTFQVVHATNDEFARAVRASVSSFRFSPALVGGHPVKQLVQMPFKFDLSK